MRRRWKGRILWGSFPSPRYILHSTKDSLSTQYIYISLIRGPLRIPSFTLWLLFFPYTHFVPVSVVFSSMSYSVIQLTIQNSIRSCVQLSMLRSLLSHGHLVPSIRYATNFLCSLRVQSVMSIGRVSDLCVYDVVSIFWCPFDLLLTTCIYALSSSAVTYNHRAHARS